MIESFRHKGLRRFYENDDRSKLPQEMLDRIGIILADLESASQLEDMNRPSFRLHPLKGELKGFYAVVAFANWRIVFRFKGGNAYDVDFLDYHYGRVRHADEESAPSRRWSEG